ncbi:MAG: lysine-2,3-aminomutase-like protein [Caulobacteraceae bacterium]|nr:lysine-2,3-aminomutase-like protein [Caulobacteraceae bacterium]
MTPDKTLTTPAALAQSGLVAPDRLPALERVAARYAVAITPASAALVDPADPHDPIARQFIPDEAELDLLPGEMADPIGDAAHSPVPGVVHRYPDRALLMLTHSCATYCRFCFRRETVGPGGGGTLSGEALEAALGYIAGQPQIWEVILTGGDPLVLSPRRLGAVMDRLAAIEHVKVVRLHTRVPAVDPDRITDALVAALKRAGKAVYVALHANHPRELTPAARAACARLIDAGLPMVSQTVLLAGVNDDPEVLGALMRAFVETRIKPYYLHQADLAPGTGHLRTSIAEGQALMRALRGRFSGLCQPTYVLDTPGGHGKVPVGPSYLSGDEASGLRIEDPWGCERPYPPASRP